MTTMQVISQVVTIVSALVALGAAITAFIGLNTWRRELAEAREVQDGPMSAVTPTIKLRKGEQCYHWTEATERKKKSARSFVEGGVRIKEHAYEAVRTGKLYVTSQRILFVAEGTTALKHPAVLDLQVDPVEHLLVITKDGRKNPYYFDVEKPHVLAAYIDRALRDADGAQTAIDRQESRLIGSPAQACGRHPRWPPGPPDEKSGLSPREPVVCSCRGPRLGHPIPDAEPARPGACWSAGAFALVASTGTGLNGQTSPVLDRWEVTDGTIPHRATWLREGRMVGPPRRLG